MGRPKSNAESSDYKRGYNSGYSKGYDAGRKAENKKPEPIRKSYWIMRKDGWYCNNCLTKHEQAHDDFCCKCGRKMSEECYDEDN